MATTPESPESEITPVPPVNPFASPYGSPAGSGFGSSSAVPDVVVRPRHFHSRRVQKGSVEKPWRDQKDPREKWATIIPVAGIFIGLAIAGFLIYSGLRSVGNHKYCVVLDDDFSNGWNDRIWSKEVEAGGYGNGQFEMTTGSDENVFIKDGQLYIKPTLQDETLIETNNVMNLTADGTCTSTLIENCFAATNITNGTIVNPVKSGRINTKLGASIKFGRIEVVAKLPAGDWIWPAIWMLPVNNKYGEWPKSGEIDIMESRGNNYTYKQGGNNIISSALHWGPNFENDGWWRNIVKRKSLRSTFSDKFHTFGIEWTEKYVFTYIDTRLLQVMYTHFDKPFWEYGQFPLADSNGTRLYNPWGFTGRDSSPFDEDFYLLMNVAVGGTNGWFDDGRASKPWVDMSPTARKDFWDARQQWFPTWEKNGQMIVKSVKMWQQEGYNGCTAQNSKKI